MKHSPSLYSLAPTSLYVYANFTDQSYVNGRVKRLLGVFDASEIFDIICDLPNAHNAHLTLQTANPMIAHVNTNTVQHLHLELETSSGEEYPFKLNPDSKTVVSLSFFYK